MGIVYILVKTSIQNHSKPSFTEHIENDVSIEHIENDMSKSNAAIRCIAHEDKELNKYKYFVFVLLYPCSARNEPTVPTALNEDLIFILRNGIMICLAATAFLFLYFEHLTDLIIMSLCISEWIYTL